MDSKLSRKTRKPVNSIQDGLLKYFRSVATSTSEIVNRSWCLLPMEIATVVDEREVHYY